VDISSRTKSARCFFGVPSRIKPATTGASATNCECDLAQSDSGLHSQSNSPQQVAVNMVHDLYVGQRTYHLMCVRVFRRFASQYIDQVDFSPRLVGELCTSRHLQRADCACFQSTTVTSIYIPSSRWAGVRVGLLSFPSTVALKHPSGLSTAHALTTNNLARATLLQITVQDICETGASSRVLYKVQYPMLL
jgi:hypothetical protein